MHGLRWVSLKCRARRCACNACGIAVSSFRRSVRYDASSPTAAPVRGGIGRIICRSRRDRAGCGLHITCKAACACADLRGLVSHIPRRAVRPPSEWMLRELLWLPVLIDAHDGGWQGRERLMRHLSCLVWIVARRRAMLHVLREDESGRDRGTRTSCFIPEVPLNLMIGLTERIRRSEVGRARAQ